MLWVGLVVLLLLLLRRRRRLLLLLLGYVGLPSSPLSASLAALLAVPAARAPQLDAALELTTSNASTASSSSSTRALLLLLLLAVPSSPLPASLAALLAVTAAGAPQLDAAPTITIRHASTASSSRALLLLTISAAQRPCRPLPLAFAPGKVLPVSLTAIRSSLLLLLLLCWMHQAVLHRPLSRQRLPPLLVQAGTNTPHDRAVWWQLLHGPDRICCCCFCFCCCCCCCCCLQILHHLKDPLHVCPLCFNCSTRNGCGSLCKSTQ
jgi:hypothetical protein